MHRALTPIRLAALALATAGLASCSRGSAAGSENAISTAPSVSSTPLSPPKTAPDTSAGAAPRQDVQTPSALKAGDHELTLLHNGLERRYLLHVPQEFSSTAPPLIIALHGGGGNAAQFKSEIGFDAISDREGLIVVYPDGTGPFPKTLHTWNAGFNCCGQAHRNEVDDVGFIRAVVNELSTTLNIDTERIAVTGHSNGGIMAYRVAAEASDLVSVAAPVAGAMALEVFAPTDPVAILHIHSLDDPRALYLGGESPPYPGTDSTVFHEPVANSLTAWAGHNGCQPIPVEAYSLAEDGQEASSLVYRNCSDVILLDQLVLSGVGHGWPGIQTGREDLIGPATTLVSASEEVWKFASEVWIEQAVSD